MGNTKQGSFSFSLFPVRCGAGMKALSFSRSVNMAGI